MSGELGTNFDLMFLVTSFGVDVHIGRLGGVLMCQMPPSRRVSHRYWRVGVVIYQSHRYHHHLRRFDPVNY